MLALPRVQSRRGMGFTPRFTFRRGFSGVTVESCHIRYPGDDGVAIWSGDNAANTNHNCVVRNNHISLNIGGCAISVYGSDNILLAGNTIVDASTAINICSGRFSPDHLGNLRVIDNAITRATIGIGFATTLSASWNMSNVTVKNLTIRDSLSSAIEFAGNVSNGFHFEHRIPSATNESDVFNSIGFAGISLSDVAIQGAKLFGLVLGTSFAYSSLLHSFHAQGSSGAVATVPCV